ncbi:MAG: polysaccharide biosynthesis protein [Gemmatimonadetes bacterium]|nr:polysaccharide biosynthesis protein [Gemmatimonadota bacterium]MYG15509.1 polysaccharide biosynthesis protein [Gemmatimonadota bacterium]
MSKRSAAVILYAALLIASVLQVFQSIVIAHFFDPEYLAPYRYGILAAGFAYLFATGLIESVFFFISGKYAPDARRYVGNTLVSCTLIFLVLLLLFEGVLDPYVLIHTELGPYLREIGAYLLIALFLFVNMTAHNALVGSGHTAAASALRVFQYLLRILAIAGALFSGLIAAIHPLILLIVVLEGIQSLLYGLVLLNRKLLSFRLRGIETRAQYRYAFGLGVAGFIPFINGSLDKIMISAFLGASSFAIYSVSAIELPIATILMSVFGSVLFSTYVGYAESGDHSSMAALWRKCSKYGMIVIVPAGIFVFLFSDVLYRLILPDAYFEGHRVLGIYALLLLLRFNSPDVLARALNRNAIIVQAATAMLIVNVAGNLVFINTFGLWGAALATLCGTAAGWIYYLARYARLLKQPVSALLPWKPYVSLVVTSAGFFGAARWTFDRVEVSAVPVILGAALVILGAAAYLWYAFSLLEKPEKAFVRDLARKMGVPLRPTD